ncbi:hypothetical protein B0H14DRAFT_2458285 [Mycena olivaceomarginata]|nr:hypothetical protein B0H14DRAFT_2458285 [Mycena olivaceomarginata]
MVFYPDNEKRASRLQQLVNSMDNMQTDIKHTAAQMDEMNEKIRPAINAMLKERQMNTVDDLIQKSMEKMTPDDKKQFEALIKAAKAAKAGFDWTYFAAGMLMLPEGAILTGKVVMSVGRFACRMQAVQGIAKFFKAASGGAEAAAIAAQAANDLEKGAIEAEAAAKEAGVAGEAGTEITEAARAMGRVSKFLKVIGVIGFVVTIVVAVVEAIQGAAQKAKLIETIQNCQPARLCIAYFKRESTNIMGQLQLVATYLELASGPEADPALAKVLSNKIVKNISADNSKIDFDKLEIEMETQDRTSGGFYGDDDLPTVTVIQKATEIKDKS